MKRVFTLPTPRIEDLTTDRLQLRPFTLADAATVVQLAGDWEVAKMMAPVPYPYPLSVAEEWIASHPRLAAEGLEVTYGLWSENNLIGSITFENRGDDVAGLGYWIGRQYWNRGYVSEAIARIIRYAFEDLDQPELTTQLFADNATSAHVLEKAGFQLVRETEGWSEARRKICPKLEYHLTRQHWQAQKRRL
jgi:RimJ/RimL family protein N-acetyltransferase